jgi:drug/metabolite transporter (DMT)-like permease
MANRIPARPHALAAPPDAPNSNKVTALHKTLVAWWLRLPPNLRGILWVTMGTIAFALNDVVVKTLGRTIDPLELAFFRYLTGFLFLAPFFARLGIEGLKTRRLHLHLMRLVMATTAQIGVLITVIHMPLAAVTALSFSRVLFTPFVAVWMLREIVTRGRWTATAVGFVGVLVMVRPDAGGIDPMALLAIGAALTFAVSNVLIRRMSSTEPPMRILFYYHLGGVLLFAGPAAWVWQTPVGIEWIYALALGLLTTLGMVGFVRGFAVGEASVIGPMEYVRLIYAAILGYVIFAEIPDPWTILGALIIVGATTSIARMEARAAKARSKTV